MEGSEGVLQPPFQPPACFFSAGAAVLPALLPSTVLYLLLVCRTEQASLFSLPLPLPSLPSLWDPQDLALVLGWIGLQAALYVLPTGKVRTTQPGFGAAIRPRFPLP